MASGSGWFRGGEALFPNLDERAEVILIGGFKRGEIGAAFALAFGFQAHRRKVEAAQEFAQEEPNDASVEILKGMHGQKAAFAKARNSSVRSPRLADASGHRA